MHLFLGYEMKVIEKHDNLIFGKLYSTNFLLIFNI